ncbi:MAG: TonB-dependent receptor [Bacteroidetes bacterium]|nr:TonB-dependent receptor [Bacteroidota bacterium]
MQNRKYWIIKLVFVFSIGYGYSIDVFSQDFFTLSGYVKDSETGETLIGANVYTKNNSRQGAVSNTYGFFSLTLPKGEYVLTFAYLGYNNIEKNVTFDKDKSLTVQLTSGIQIEEIIVTADDNNRNVQSTEIGTITLSVDKIKTLPTFMGEVDVMKALQLLPGVISGGEGTSGFYVRGGSPDQNLILLDEAVMYNPGHLMGFFSVFNSNAIKHATLIKGGIPANYGGRLASVVDIKMKEGNDKYYQAEGGLGLIASRLTFEGPIVKEKSSFIVSARRTYAFELAQPFLDSTDYAGTNYYFYDLNVKANYSISDRDKLFFSAYTGKDVLDFNSSEGGYRINLPYGNTTATLRWNHLIGSKTFMNFSAIFNRYEFSFTGGQSDLEVEVFSGIKDYNAKLDFDYYPNNFRKIQFGLNYTYHKVTPNITNATTGSLIVSNNLEPRYVHEMAAYFLDDVQINSDLSLNFGMRLSLYSQLGPYTSKIDSTVFGKGEPVKNYIGIEPRLKANWRISDNTSIKGGVSMTNQYLHLVSNSTISLPIDIWVPSTESIKPQLGTQASIGFFGNIPRTSLETSVELFYSKFWNQVDYSESYVNTGVSDVEDGFVFGTGKSYGAELYLNKTRGKLTGWIGYTLSRTTRTFEEINDGKPFSAIYDRTHDLSLVLNLALKKRWTFSSAFVYSTGSAVTPIKSLFLVDQNFHFNYGERNSVRIDPFSRLDLSATFTPKPEVEKNFSSSWTFSVYNVYNRRNPLFIYYSARGNPGTGTGWARGIKVSLFPVIPTITWNFKWKFKKEENDN